MNNSGALRTTKSIKEKWQTESFRANPLEGKPSQINKKKRGEEEGMTCSQKRGGKAKRKQVEKRLATRYSGGTRQKS